MFFQLNTRMHAGIGMSRKLGEFVRSLGWQDYAIVVDGALVRTPYFQEISKQIDGWLIKICAKHEPTYTQLQALAEEVRHFDKLDGIIAIGGGSTLDLGKALAALRNNWLPAIEYRGFDKLTKMPVPTICIPTTAGTGSEATPNAVFTDTVEKKKLGINGRFINATYAILDAEWTRSCPMEAAVSAGIDALVHALESWMCNQANPITRAWSREAFRLLYKNLPYLVDDTGRSFTGRIEHQKLLLGAYLAGAALCNSGSGIAGALSYPLGVHYGIPHGIAGGMFIADVVQWNVDHGYHDFGDLLSAIEQNPGWAPERANDFAKMIRDLSDALGVPRSLDSWGVTMRLGGLDRPPLASLQPAFDQNPVKFTASDAYDLIASKISGATMDVA